jgi:hypothetical protein
MNDANPQIQKNDGKTAKDVCGDEQIERLFIKYETAVPAKSSNEIIKEADEEDDSDDDALSGTVSFP